MINFLKNNALSFSPILLIPASYFSGGSLIHSLQAAGAIMIGLAILDKALDVIVHNAKLVIAPEYLVLLLAATTNLPELAASQGAAFGGDLFFDAGSTPLGSNWANVTLVVPAILLALGSRGLKTKGFIGTLSDFGWSSMKKQLIIASIFAADAIFFQYWIRPACQIGDYSILWIWLGVNILLLSYYFQKNTFSTNAKWANTIDSLDFDSFTKIKELSANSNTPASRPLVSLMGLLEDYEKQPGLQSLEKIKQELAGIKNLCHQNPETPGQITQILSQEDTGLDMLFKLAGFKLSENNEINPLSSYLKLAAGTLAVLATAPLLDRGVVDISFAIEGLGKSSAGFFIMSYISSLPELLTTTKLFQSSLDRGATKNIADSNALNILLALLAMATASLI